MKINPATVAPLLMTMAMGIKNKHLSLILIAASFYAASRDKTQLPSQRPEPAPVIF